MKKYLLIAALVGLAGCGKPQGCTPGETCINPQEFGNQPIYHYYDGELTMVQYYADNGNDQQLCGLIMNEGTGIEAWSLRDNWNRHHFNTLLEAQDWLTTNWCKP